MIFEKEILKKTFFYTNVIIFSLQEIFNYQKNDIKA